MDGIGEVGQKVKDQDAPLKSPEGLSNHVECHNLLNTNTHTFSIHKRTWISGTFPFYYNT